MLSKNQHKLITSLNQKKYRQKHGLFMVEGPKVVNEFLDSSFELVEMYAIESYMPANALPFIPISERELNQISNLRTPNQVMAIFKIAEASEISTNDLVVALDGINDPGNLGTIIRLCDWFGVKQIVCSLNTVDCYNPKVVQASMGSLTRVRLNYTDLWHFLKSKDLPIYIAMMEGKKVTELPLSTPAILVMGNEANGISPEVIAIADQALSIPRFNQESRVESLNVATATAILLSQWRA